MNRWENIIAACKDGNLFAQNRLYDAYAKRLFRLCLRYVPQHADAEEVLMNGFLKIFRSLADFEYRDDKGLEAWMKRIMVNEALMFLRQQKSLPIFAEESSAEHVASFSQPDASVSAEAIYAAILDLPTGYRTVFNLYVMEGYTHDEIASQLGISPGTSKSQLSKARVILQETLKRIGYEHSGTF